VPGVGKGYSCTHTQGEKTGGDIMAPVSHFVVVAVFFYFRVELKGWSGWWCGGWSTPCPFPPTLESPGQSRSHTKFSLCSAVVLALGSNAS